MHEYAEIYLMRNLVTNKVYVGSSVQASKRHRGHTVELIQGKHGNRYLQNAWRKYGAENFTFEIIERCPVVDRREREQWWIDQLRAVEREFGYNLANPVSSVVPSPYMSAVTKKRWEENAEFAATVRAGLAKGRAKTNARQDEEFLAKRAAIFDKARAAMHELWDTDPLKRENQSKNCREQWLIPEIQAVRRESLDRGRVKVNSYWFIPGSKVRMVREENLSKGLAALRECRKDPEWRANCKTGSRTKELWQDPEYRAKQMEHLPETQAKGIQAMAEVMKTPEWKAAQSARSKARWQNPEYRAARLAGLARANARKSKEAKARKRAKARANKR
jgi:group I intron endonuclease